MSEQKDQLQEAFIAAANTLEQTYAALVRVESEEYPGRDGSETFISQEGLTQSLAEAARKFLERSGRRQ